MRKVTVTSLFTSEDFQALALTSDNWANERRAQVGLQFIGSRIWCTVSPDSLEKRYLRFASLFFPTKTLN